MSIRAGWSVVLVAVIAAAGCKDKDAKDGKAPPETAAKVKAEPAAKVLEAPVIAMAVLVEGHSMWLGNDSYEEEEAARFQGYFADVGKALDTLAKAGSTGSKAALITYGIGAKVRRPFEDATTLSAAALGTQQDHDKVLQRDLLAGLALAITELSAQSAPRKVLVVIGDGIDTNRNADLVAPIAALKTAGIETYTIHASSEAIEGSFANMQKLGTAGSFELADGAAKVVEKLDAAK